MSLSKEEHKYNQLQRSAKERHKEFNLTVENVKKLINKTTCDYTGVTFSNNRESPLFKTIDRVDPNLGYIVGNVVVCTAIANHVKNVTIEKVAVGVVKSEERKVLESIMACMSASNFKEKLLRCSLPTDKIQHTLELSKFADRYKRLVNTNTTARFEMENLTIDTTKEEEIQQVVITSTEVQKSVQTKHNIPLPPDVEIARAYVGFAEKYPSMNLTFSAFSGKLTKKTCEFSKDKIENVFLFVLDSTRPVTYHNVIAIDAKYKPVLEAIQNTGVSINNFGTMLKNLSSNYQID